MKRLSRILPGQLYLSVALMLPSGCHSGPEERCPGDAFGCEKELAQWPIRTSAPADYTFDDDQVIDGITGLMWQRNVPSDMYRWQRAHDYCEGLRLAGQSDWRLPSRLELVTLLEYERLDFRSGRPEYAAQPSPLIDSTAFPDAPASEFWTDSYFGDDLQAWTLSFATGLVTAQPAELLLPRARCVRTARAPKAPATSVESRFAVKTETATERATGLVWQRKLGDTVTNEEAQAYCAKLSLDGSSGFRLPHVKELLTLAAATTDSAPAIDTDLFVGPSRSYDGEVWTATPAGPDSFRGVSYDSLFTVDFANGGRLRNGSSSFSDTKHNDMAPVRCVRTTGAASIDPQIPSDPGLRPPVP